MLLLLQVCVSHVVGILDGPPGSSSLSADDVATVRAHMQQVPPKAWDNFTGSLGVPSCQAAPGSAATARVALQMSGKVAWHMFNTDPDLLVRINKQRKVGRGTLGIPMTVSLIELSLFDDDDLMVMVI